jgi:hypothetical protein
MKITEITEHVEWHGVLNLVEALDTKFDVVNWVDDESGSTARVTLDDAHYELLVEYAMLSLNDKQYSVLNIAFATLNSAGEYTTDFRGGKSNASRIYGAILNAMSDKFAEITRSKPVDFLLFAAKDDVVDGATIKTAEQKLSLYKKMVTSKLVGLPNWTLIGKLTLNNGATLIASRNHLGSDEMAELIDYLKTKNKALN